MTTITIYENNSVVISSTMSTVISGFTGSFFVKKYKSDDTPIIHITGATTTGDTVTFTLSTTHTNIKPGKYQYEIRITDGSHTYTTNAGDFVVLDSLATNT